MSMAVDQDRPEAMLAPSEAERTATRLYLLKERTSLALDVLWVLAVSGGVGWLAWVHIGLGWGLIVGGLVLALLTNIASASRDREPKLKAPPPPKRQPPPGPKDPGNLHVSGG